jgi:2',5'-phosphodiesterase
MGVALAWPTDTLEAVDVDISRLSDKRVGGWPERDEKKFFTELWGNVQSTLGTPLRFLGFKGEREKEDHWSISERRFNVLLTATLRDKESGQAFCIGTYHMPCCFYAPMVMAIHSEMAVKHVQDIAAKDNFPYILAGDFNIKPGDPSYQLITTGKLDKGDPCYPSPKNGYEWISTIDPLRSAYGESSGEPDFTNYARIRENDPFIDCLDYIFVSPSWKIENVLSLPRRDLAGGPFPNLDKGEPSDHILIAADLACSTDNK